MKSGLYVIHGDFYDLPWSTQYGGVNSLAPGRSECDSKNVIFNLVLLIGIFRSSHDNAPWWMPQDLTDDKSTLLQVMAWCRQATSHYLSQCWPRSMSPYGVIRPQWDKCDHWYSQWAWFSIWLPYSIMWFHYERETGCYFIWHKIAINYQQINNTLWF